MGNIFVVIMYYAYYINNEVSIHDNSLSSVILMPLWY